MLKQKYLLNNYKNLFFNYYTTNLTLLEKNNLLGNYFGREEELKIIMEILLQSKNSNILLVGPKGIGKKSLIKLLVKELQKKKFNQIFNKPQVICINLIKLILPIFSTISLNVKLKILATIINKYSHPIVIMDNVHQFFEEANKQNINVQQINLFKLFVEQCNCSFIFTTTDVEYEDFLSKSNELISFFKVIHVEEIAKKDLIKILFTIKSQLEKYYNIIISESILYYILETIKVHLKDFILPKIVIDILDIAASKFIVKDFLREDSTILPILLNFIQKLNILEFEAFNLNDYETAIELNYIQQIYKKYLIPLLENNYKFNSKIINKILFKKKNNLTKLFNLNLY